jgi:protein-S-isoprenylcysteine O-methyltransferase Ste14
MLKAAKKIAVIIAYKVYFPLLLLALAYEGDRPFANQPFVSDPSFIIVFVAFLLGDAVVAPFSMLKTHRSEPQPDKQVDKANVAIVFGAIRGIIAASVFEHVKIPLLHPTAPMAIVGSAVLLSGLMLRLWSIRSLAQNYTQHIRAEADQVIVGVGAYRYIRHPIYSGTFLYVFGFALGMSSVAGMALAAGFLLPYYISWALKEERHLASVIGERYRQYLRKTKRFIPFIL